MCYNIIEVKDNNILRRIHIMKGSVIIKKEQEPNGVMYYMTGKRDVLTNWDMNGNYTEKSNYNQGKCS